MLKSNHPGFFFFSLLLINFYSLKTESHYPRLAYYVCSSGFFFLCQMSDVSNFITRFEGGTCHRIMWILNHHAYESKKDPASSTLISYFIISNICESAKKAMKWIFFFLHKFVQRRKIKPLTNFVEPLYLQLLLVMICPNRVLPWYSLWQSLFP